MLTDRLRNEKVLQDVFTTHRSNFNVEDGSTPEEQYGINEEIGNLINEMRYNIITAMIKKRSKKNKRTTTAAEKIMNAEYRRNLFKYDSKTKMHAFDIGEVLDVYAHCENEYYDSLIQLQWAIYCITGYEKPLLETMAYLGALVHSNLLNEYTIREFVENHIDEMLIENGYVSIVDRFLLPYQVVFDRRGARRKKIIDELENK